jgi:hypothetical protein
MAEPITGGLFRADADSITGWCWCAARPQIQCSVEVLIDGVVWRELKANRRAEGVRLNGPPHDHFGFLATLPPREGARWHRIEVREQRTQQVFGRLMEGGPDLARAEVEQRIDAVRKQAAEAAAELAALPRPIAVARLLGAIGAGLLGPQLPPLTLRVPAAPKVTLVVTSCRDSAQAHRAIEVLALPAADLGAEVLLLGDLQGGLVALATVVRGVQLIDGDAIGDALDAARGEYVLVLDGARLGAGLDLTQWLRDGVTVGGGALILGIKRDDWRAMAGIEAIGLPAAVQDVALQAQVLGLPLRTVGAEC